ncbi:MAG: T9SS type A sorting domain-containing protein [Flavobacteriales bacterium]
MHKLLIVCVWVFVFYSKTHAQINLVPNSSFEDTVPPPRPPGHINFVQNWVNPTAGSPDYYHVCPPVACVPEGGGGFQYPNIGNAFIGIYAYDETSTVREYVQVQLMDTLVGNKCYVITFYANLANWSGKACNNLGVYLSDTAISSSNFNVLQCPSQIKIFNNEIINDTLDWHKIEGIYAANGGELFLTLGNFNNDLTTDTITSNYSSIYPSAYYLIDDVSVIPIDSIPGGMPANAGADTNVIVGDSVFIGQQISNLNCNWYNAIGSLIANGTSGIYVSPTVSTFYVVEQNLCGVITYDTVNVTVLPVSIYELQNNNSVQIYPNPNNGSFTIEHNHNLNDAPYILEIIDVMGKVVHQEKITTKKQTINTEQLSTGLYFVNVNSTTGKLMYSVKISVIH